MKELCVLLLVLTCSLARAGVTGFVDEFVPPQLFARGIFLQTNGLYAQEFVPDLAQLDFVDVAFEPADGVTYRLEIRATSLIGPLLGTSTTHTTVLDRDFRERFVFAAPVLLQPGMLHTLRLIVEGAPAEVPGAGAVYVAAGENYSRGRYVGAFAEEGDDMLFSEGVFVPALLHASPAPLQYASESGPALFFMNDATFTNGWVEDFGGAVLRVGFGPYAMRGDYLNVSNIVNGFVYVGGIHVGLATRLPPYYDLIITFNSNAYENTVQRLMRALYFVNVEGEPFPGTRNLSVVFSNVHAMSEATIPIYVVPVNDPPSAYGQINARLGLPGTGDFFIAGTNGRARVILDASNSRDLDSSVLRYGWTVTNPKARTVFSSTNVIATVELRPRVYMTGLRVSDGEFDSDAAFQIEVITAPIAVRRLLRHVRAELPARTERPLASLLTGATAAYARKQYESAHLYLESFINRVQQTPTIPDVLRDGWSNAARMIIEETE